MDHTVHNISIRHVSKQTYLKTFLLHIFAYNIFLLCHITMGVWLIQQNIDSDFKTLYLTEVETNALYKIRTQNAGKRSKFK